MVRVQSGNNTITTEELTQMRMAVAEMEKNQWLKMTMLYYIGQAYSVSGTYEGEDFVITLS